MSRLLILLLFVAITAALPYPADINFESPPVDNENPEDLALRHRRPNYGFGNYGYGSYNNYYSRPSYGGYGYNSHYNKPSYGYSSPYTSYGHNNYNNYNSYGGYNTGYNNYYSGYNNYGYSGYGSGNYLGWREATKSSATSVNAAKPAAASSSPGTDSTAVKFE